MLKQLMHKHTVAKLYVESLSMTETFARRRKTIREISFRIDLRAPFTAGLDLYCCLSMFRVCELGNESNKYSDSRCSVQFFGNDIYRTAMFSIQNSISACSNRAVNGIPQFGERMKSINVFLTNKR
jgi:hypothetical protein